MVRSPNWCAVILAAGESSRMGTDKALLPWPPASAGHAPVHTFLTSAIRSLSPFSEMVIVVAGRNQARLAPLAYAEGATIITNPHPEHGQFSSMQVGLQAVLNYGRDAAIVTLVDRPPASAGVLSALTNGLVSAPHGAWMVVPEHNGKHGHPVILGREMIEAFLKAPINSTARDLEHHHRHHIHYVPVDDPTVTLNVNTPEDYAALAATIQPAQPTENNG
ncbi:MAG TPA: nucleotidyltransferase family protein [Terriglobales bacterium]